MSRESNSLTIVINLYHPLCVMFKMVMLKVETLDLILAVPDKEITY